MKENIKAGDIITIKTWEEIKKVHGDTLNENYPAHKSVCNFLKKHAGKKRTVHSTKLNDDNELSIYIQEDKELYLLLSEVKKVMIYMRINDDLFEI